MTKPTGVQVSAALMVLLIVLEVAAQFLAPRDAIVPGSRMDNPAFAFMVQGGAALIFGVISAVFVYFYWAGHNWARWVVMVYGGLCLLGLIALAAFHHTALEIAVKVGKALLAIFLFWYLNTPPVAAWFSRKSQAPTAAV